MTGFLFVWVFEGLGHQIPPYLLYWLLRYPKWPNAPFARLHPSHYHL